MTPGGHPAARPGAALLAALWLAIPGAATGGQAAPSDRLEGWEDFAPGEDVFAPDSELDLRFLNERRAGDGGFIRVVGKEFVHGRTGHPVRFWGVVGPPESVGGEVLRRTARFLAKRGVNLVRIHGALYDKDGAIDPARVLHVIEVVEAMKTEGIYSLLSIYFPLWLEPQAGNPWLAGYDGHTHPFATLMFSPGFQEHYRDWWVALLTTPSPATGVRLVDEPAVAAVEIQNEDSFLFGTFAPEALPDVQIQFLEARFGAWLAARYGSADAALDRWTEATPGMVPAPVGGTGSIGGAWRRGVRHAVAWWKGVALPRDAPRDGRIAIRPLWSIVRDRTPRDQDTVRFLVEVQSSFYGHTRDFLRGIGFQGAITASNWMTADQAILGPLEKMTYLGGDFLDRHAYFDCGREGERAAYQVREGHTYRDRSVLRLESEEGIPLGGINPAASPIFDGRASAVSEVSWTRPNRHRSEAPVFLAAFGAQQETSAMIHFALDSDRWSVQPRPFVQPWTLMSPGMMGQFPAAAFLFRQGLVKPGVLIARVTLERGALDRLEGLPGLLDERPDALRAADATPAALDRHPTGALDPLSFLAGRVEVTFTDGPGPSRVEYLPVPVDRSPGRPMMTAGDLQLDLARGMLVLDAPGAQGAIGNLAAGAVATRDLEIRSDLPIGNVVAVALDGLPLKVSRRILLQVMSEEQPTGFRSLPAEGGRRRIAALGRDPWQFRSLRGTVSLRRPDADRLRVQALDGNGQAISQAIGARAIELRPATLYYLITVPDTSRGPQRLR